VTQSGDPLSFLDILNMKRDTEPTVTCYGLNSKPSPFSFNEFILEAYSDILAYIRALSETTEPDYEYICKAFMTASAVVSTFDTDNL
jgi:hypothetical protein